MENVADMMADMKPRDIADLLAATGADVGLNVGGASFEKMARALVRSLKG